MALLRTRPARRWSRSLLLVSAALALAACGRAADSTTSSDPSQEAVVELADPVRGEVPSVLDFSATLVGGGAFDGASLAGKPVALWFWAPG